MFFLQAHDTAASSLADDGFKVFPPPCAFGAMSRSRSRFGSSRWAGLVVFFALTTPLLRPWLTTASRFKVAPPTCAFGAMPRPSSRFGSSRSAGFVVFFVLATPLLRPWLTTALRLFGGYATMRLRRYVSLEKSIPIVSLGEICRVFRAHDTVASSLADDCFAV